MKNLLLLLLLITGLAACNSVDDQTIATFDRLASGNPTPLARNFKAINDQHQILVGVVDTGVDYNQPFLKENAHFKLDASGKPVGYGYDLTGEDSWASPYVIRTSDYNPEIDPELKRKSQLEAYNTNLLLKENPGFVGFLDPYRNLLQENKESAYHGTHVAGLASYDRPDIGVIGYRAIPFNEVYKKGQLIKGNQGDQFADTIVDASLRAIQDGVRVINMSLGSDGHRPLNNEVDAAKEFELQKVRTEKLRQVALANPNVVFVVAAGNDGKWIDQNTRLGLPCGVQAPNILCVGAADKNGNVANFSNLLLSEGAFVMAFGVDVLSTMPTSMCVTDEVEYLSNEKLATDPNLRKQLADLLSTKCSSRNLKKLSGTSMASPIMAREVAKVLIANPNQTGAQAIQALLAKGQNYKMGQLNFPRLKVEKPSWYSTLKPDEQDDWMRKHGDLKIPTKKLGDADDFFEFVIPNGIEN